MRRKGFLCWLVASLLVLAFTACGGGADDPANANGISQSGGSTGADGAAGTHAGMGSSTAAPTGTSLVVPDGIQLEAPIRGYDFNCPPKDQQDTPRTGNGGLVRLCLGFRNATAHPITVVLPSGLIFVSDSQAYQTGMLLKVTQIDVPAQAPTYYVPLYLYCLNESRLPTQSGQNTYTTGPVTDDGAVLDLLSLLKDKPLPLLVDDRVQQALWHITDGHGLTEDDRKAISGL